MILEIEKSGHRFFEPVLKQIAELIDKKYEIKFDSTADNIGGPSFTVVHKKLKEHGLHIKMVLGAEGEVEINGYFNHLFPIYPSKFNITPSRDTENFPLLNPVELAVVEKKIKAIEKATLRDIKALADDFSNNSLGLTKDNVFSLVSNGKGVDLSVFAKYGLEVNYKGYLLSPSRDMLTNYRLIEVIYASNKDKKVKALLPDIINMYIDEVKNQDASTGLKSIRRFDSKISDLFTADNETNYIKMVKSMYPFSEGYEFVPDLDGWTVTEYMTTLNNDRIENELLTYFYAATDDENFLSDEAKDIFLF